MLGTVFCEGRGVGVPEYTNCFSALVLILFGIYGIASGPPSVRHLYALLLTNGMGSFAFHWTNADYWGGIDQISMLMLGSMFCGIILQSLTNRTIASRSLTHAALSAIAHIVTMAGFVFVLATNHNLAIDVYLAANLAIPLSIWNGMILFPRSSLHILYYRELPQGVDCARRLRSSSIALAIAAIAWLSYEKFLCITDLHVWGRIPVHAMFHIVSSASLFNVLQQAAILICQDSNGERYVLQPWVLYSNCRGWKTKLGYCTQWLFRHATILPKEPPALSVASLKGTQSQLI